MVAYLLFARGHACLEHSPVTLNSFRQKVCELVLNKCCVYIHAYIHTCIHTHYGLCKAQAHFALKEQNPFFMTPQITYTCTYVINMREPAQTNSLRHSAYLPRVQCVLRSKVDRCALIGPACTLHCLQS